MDTRENHTRQLAFTGLFAAVIAVMSIIQIPMPSGVPMTLQTFAVALCGYVLGKNYGFAATLLYVLLGAVGLPVFAGMKAGFGVLLGPTGGFLIGFIFMAGLCGWGKEMNQKAAYWGMGLAGLAVSHVFGALQYHFVTGTPVAESFLLVSLPYVVKDIISVAIAGFAAIAVRRSLAAAGITFGKING